MSPPTWKDTTSFSWLSRYFSIFHLFYFQFHFHYFELRWRSVMWHYTWWKHNICYKVVIYVTATITQSYNTKKNIKGSEIGNIIQYDNNIVMEHFDTNIFLSLLSIFLDFIFLFFWISFEFLFLFSDDEEARDIAVTWHVTWCDVISLKHSGKI